MLYVHGVGHFHPHTIIDNKFLADLDIGVDEEWILQRVGIRQRRTVLDPDYIRRTRNCDVRAAREASTHSNAQTGARAAEMALARAKLTPGDIGLVIAGGCSPDNQIPADACCIAAELGIDAPGFDINSACSSFAVQLWMLSNFRTERGPDFILVVNPDNNTRSVNYNDRRTSVLWGDASTAAIVSTRVVSPLRVDCRAPNSSPANWAKVRTPNGEHFDQEGHAVQAFAIRTMSSLLSDLREQDDVIDDIYFIGHQANLLALEAVRKRLNFPEENHWSTLNQ